MSRSRYDAVVADRERLRSERNQFLTDRNAAQAAARSAAEKFTHADDELAATRIVNSCLTDDIVKLRKQLDEAHAHADRLQKRLDDQPTPGRNPR